MYTYGGPRAAFVWRTSVPEGNIIQGQRNAMQHCVDQWSSTFSFNRPPTGTFLQIRSPPAMTSVLAKRLFQFEIISMLMK